ncbi:copper resistance CopC/CopD family protein [Dongia deserti]|uniref:copper resistance CopC/CopD family protein n=1 Tax=Dongia deserti TaxID=2268030 RepID=UPI000E6532FD|nr:copper resistance protein CopC [Dongia deserti]
MARAFARLRTGAGFLALVLAFLLASPAGAWAHAVLQGTSPAADSVHAHAPERIELIFNEPVQLLDLRVIDDSGRDCSPPTTPKARDGRVTWVMQDHLPDGRYLVSWRVGSLDGHVISGSFTFAIGTAGAGAMPAQVHAEESHWPVLALHALARLALLFASGTALFRLLLAPRSLESPLHLATRWIALSGVLAMILFIGAEGAVRAGLLSHALLSIESWQAALAAPNFEWRGFSIIGLALLAARATPLSQWLGIAVSLLGMADSGHVLAVLPAGMGHGLMILHGLTAALWIGAIGPLRLALKRDASAETVDLFRRFQTYGALAMAGTLASGILLTILLLPRVADLWQSAYGLRLCAKLGAVAVMLGIAATNRLWLTRRAMTGAPSARALLRRVLGLDMAAASLATMLAVGLSLGPPPSALTLTIAHDRYDVALSFSPGRIGDNDLSIALTPKEGAPADPKEVVLRLSAPGIEPILRKAERTGPGRYGLRDLPLWVAGPWQLQLGILVDDFTRLRLRAEIILVP